MGRDQQIPVGVAGDGVVIVDNPYWDEVRDAVDNDPVWGGATVKIYSLDGSPYANRHDLVGRYARTITDPATVAFVAEHAGPRVLDPMAGSGYWAHLLSPNADVPAFDLNPPDAGGNHWHKQGVTHAPVTAGDAAEVAALHGQGRTLLLSWPPYDDPIGVNVVRAYTGDRIIYIGESDGGCCGDDALFEEFRTNWVEIAEHRPVQYIGMHDYVTVYDRKPGA